MSRGRKMGLRSRLGMLDKRVLSECERLSSSVFIFSLSQSSINAYLFRVLLHRIYVMADDGRPPCLCKLCSNRLHITCPLPIALSGWLLGDYRPQFQHGLGQFCFNK